MTFPVTVRLSPVPALIESFDPVRLIEVSPGAGAAAVSDEAVIESWLPSTLKLSPLAALILSPLPSIVACAPGKRLTLASLEAKTSPCPVMVPNTWPFESVTVDAL